MKYEIKECCQESFNPITICITCENMQELAAVKKKLNQGLARVSYDYTSFAGIINELQSVIESREDTS